MLWFEPCRVIWYELYSCEMSRRKGKPRLGRTPGSGSAEVQDVPAAAWRRLLFGEMGFRTDATWKEELTHVNLNTGMPEQTKQVLRSDVFLVLFPLCRALFRPAVIGDL